METGLKQRLVGAIVLITLGIVFIPLLLNGVNQSPEAESPADESREQARNSFSSRIVPLATPDAIEPSASDDGGDNILDLPMMGARKAESSSPRIPLVNKSKVKPASNTGTIDKSDSAKQASAEAPAETGTAAKPKASPAPKPAAKPKVSPAPKPAAKPAPKPAPSPQPAKVASTDSHAPASSAGVPVRESQPVVEKRKGWVVQVGSFAAELNAKKLRDRLKGERYSAYVDAISSDTGSMFRVRVGPVDDREQAAQLQQRLVEQDSLKGILVHLP
jgi:DedD protein